MSQRPITSTSSTEASSTEAGLTDAIAHPQRNPGSTSDESDKNPVPPSSPGWCLSRRDPGFIRACLPWWEWAYHHYFRVQTAGWEHISASGQVLIVGAHNGGFAAPDMFMMMLDWFRRFGVERPAYGLMDANAWKLHPSLSESAAKLGAVVAHPKMAIAALDQGASVLVYPGGVRDLFRPHHLRDRICLFNNQAFVKLALRYELPIIPVISHGAHDTLIVLGDAYPLVEQLHRWGLFPWINGVNPGVFPVYLGLPWGVGLGPLPNLPLPMTIHTRVCKPVWFPRYGAEAAGDRAYVNVCYEQVQRHMQRSLDHLIAEVA
ncbi:glycerol acyltransferase [Thermoleptolyngbya sichuanensis XZ-Cy5]|uniref:1-acyl-sn-glycerol-3-phosphate acyltransferase n=1 Tax=Thermoleptolyngbya sichuanensis TaxID=2885951 RepID=UPI00240D25A0|nr:1-acyl-sn-glycerol-3-phosphate acyltransferase [Thermoleptolyngbya sichuanensis]MDG2617704.1 glycerol acyltransferase [Thermoleptolyngbya sichuanensis XZ-Cy5]